MIDFLQRPLVVFVLFAGALWLAARLGARFGAARPLADDLREDFDMILPASLTLLGLLIAFSFSMAASRYDLRKNYEEAEANAIGTEYVRANLLPPADAAKVQLLLKQYLGVRVAWYAETGPRLAAIDARTTQLQNDLWSAVLPPAAKTPTPVVALAVAGMNDVLNSQGYTQAAWRNRIPVSAWLLMAAIALLCNAMIGYGAKSRKHGGRLLVIFPLLAAVAFMLIEDIDTPRLGLIHVVPQNLLSLAASLNGPSG
jgi:hypothetical protein